MDGAKGAAGDDPDLDAAMLEATRLARDAWDDEHDEAAFFTHVASKIVTSPTSAAIRALAIADLATAWAATLSDARAAARLKALLDDNDAAIVRAGATGTRLEEVKQSVLASIVLPREDKPPEILDYAGKGPLGAWLRVVAIRVARKAARKEDREVEIDAVLLERIGTSPDIAALLAKLSSKEAVAAALREAVAKLEPRQRTLIKYQVLDGLGVTEVGSIYGVHRATAARWVADAREALGRSFRALLAERLRLPPGEVESFVGLVGSQLDVSVERLLAGG